MIDLEACLRLKSRLGMGLRRDSASASGRPRELPAHLQLALGAHHGSGNFMWEVAAAWWGQRLRARTGYSTGGSCFEGSLPLTGP